MVFKVRGEAILEEKMRHSCTAGPGVNLTELCRAALHFRRVGPCTASREVPETEQEGAAPLPGGLRASCLSRPGLSLWHSQEQTEFLLAALVGITGPQPCPS